METTRGKIKARGPGGRPRTWSEPSATGTAIMSQAARRGLRLQDVAEKAGISVACLYGIVSGRTADPGISIGYAIAGALGVRIEKLFPPRAPISSRQTKAAR
jgi:predicted DNA-binding transcriptional regulator AlpA